VANNLLVNPMVITSSVAPSYKTQLAAASPNAGKNNTSYGTLTTLLIEKAEWNNPANVGDTITIGDPQSGATLLQMRCEVAGSAILVDWQANPRLWLDWELNAMPSGTLYLFTR
jgi:hypothetical protein